MRILFILLAWMTVAGSSVADSLKAQQSKICAQRLVETLAHDLTTPIEYREPVLKEFWTKYKNDNAFYAWLEESLYGRLANTRIDLVLKRWEKARKNFKPNRYVPKVYDLDSPLAHQITSCAFGPLTSLYSKHGLRPGDLVSQYYLMVAQLRKGDTVRFGNDAQFTLGEFVNRGNGTHIFLIEGDDEHVLRIPILSLHGRKTPDHAHDAERATALGREALATWVAQSKLIADTILKTEISKQDPKSRFVVVERIYGTLNARDFVIDLLARAFPTTTVHFQDVVQGHYFRKHVRDIERPFRHDLELRSRLWEIAGRNYESEGGIKAGRAYLEAQLRAVASSEEIKMLDEILKIEAPNFKSLLPRLCLKGGTQQDGNFHWLVGISLRQVTWDVKRARWVLNDWDDFDVTVFGTGP